MLRFGLQGVRFQTGVQGRAWAKLEDDAPKTNLAATLTPEPKILRPKT